MLLEILVGLEAAATIWTLLGLAVLLVDLSWYVVLLAPSPSLLAASAFPL